MLLYRGIAVPEASAITTANAIRKNGLALDIGFWNLAVHDLKPRLHELWASPHLSQKLTNPDGQNPVRRLCACASRADALYYACSHNLSRENNASIIVAFEADQSDVIVDGRDFLGTVMQLGQPVVSRPHLERIFGPSVLRYADRGWATEEQDIRIACLHLAIQDDDVVKAHAANNVVLGGRHRTRLRSAFMVKAPINAASIRFVERVDAGGYVLPNIELSLEQALGR